jgi:hypothetical protein
MPLLIQLLSLLGLSRDLIFTPPCYKRQPHLYDSATCFDYRNRLSILTPYNTVCRSRLTRIHNFMDAEDDVFSVGGGCCRDTASRLSSNFTQYISCLSRLMHYVQLTSRAYVHLTSCAYVHLESRAYVHLVHLVHLARRISLDYRA